MEPIEVVDHDPRWPVLYAEEAQKLCPVFGASLMALEHIGSTSVSGLAAKPIVDIQAVVRSLADIDSVTPNLAALGWEQGVFALDPERRRYFKKYNAVGVRAYQLHIYEPDHLVGAAHLLFRDYLRAHPEEAEQYADLKRDLAGRFRFDRIAYNDAKTEYVNEVLAKARTYFRGGEYGPD